MAATNGRVSFQDIANPLFIHPSDGASAIQIEKLQGSSDYRSWKRAMEINLASKRKLGFVQGTIDKPTDAVQAELWEICNNMVIAWLTHNVSASIMKSVMFMTSARDIWLNLEKRFALTNGSRKYKINKDLYDLKQQSKSVNEYYTSMRSLWEELDALNTLPLVKEHTNEVKTLLAAIFQEQEETKLFQFLNGLDSIYNAQRSHFLLLNPLPSVETVSAALQQEEAQRELLHLNTADNDLSAMYSKVQIDRPVITCSACGVKGHRGEKCWTVVGFPSWHPKHAAGQVKGKGTSGYNVKRSTGFKQGGASHKAMAANVTMPDTTGTLFTPQQLAQLAKLVPQLTQTRGSDTDEELDNHFSGMISYNASEEDINSWIIDSGASAHMTPHLNKLTDVMMLPKKTTITLPTRDNAVVTHMGTAPLDDKLQLKKVLCVPLFKFSLLSVQQFVADNNYQVLFHPTYCVIMDTNTNEIRGIGKAKNGLYYLENHSSVKLRNFPSTTVSLSWFQ